MRLLDALLDVRRVEPPPVTPVDRGLRQAFSLEASTVSYNSAISACEKAELWQEALHLFAQARTRRLHPDVLGTNVSQTSKVDRTRDRRLGGERQVLSSELGNEPPTVDRSPWIHSDDSFPPKQPEKRACGTSNGTTMPR